MNDDSFVVLTINNELDKELKKLSEILQDSDYKGEYDKFMENYQQVKKNNIITIAFVGNYSVGKSSIIKALTGDENIEIGRDVTTRQAGRYDYQGIYIIDTPGLESGDKKHTAITKDEIIKSDIIAYCITVNGASPKDKTVMKDIIKMLGKNIGSKFILCMNKIDQEYGAQGNDDYEKYVTTCRYNLEDIIMEIDDSDAEIMGFPFSTQFYIDGRKDQDDELIKKSLFDFFIDHLNEICRNKDYEVKGKIQRKLDVTCNFIREIREKRINSYTDEEKKKRDREIEKMKNELSEESRTFLRDVKEKYRDWIDNFRRWLSDEQQNIPREEIHDKINRELQEIRSDIENDFDSIRQNRQEKIDNFKWTTPEISGIKEIKNKKRGSKLRKGEIGSKTAEHAPGFGKYIMDKVAVATKKETFFAKFLSKFSKKRSIKLSTSEKVASKIAPAGEFFVKHQTAMGVAGAVTDLALYFIGDIIDLKNDEKKRGNIRQISGSLEQISADDRKVCENEIKNLKSHYNQCINERAGENDDFLKQLYEIDQRLQNLYLKIE